MRVRTVRSEELERCQAIERAAGAPFAALGMEAIANDEPLSTDILASFQTAGCAWGCADGDDLLVAYIVVKEVDGCGHIEQVSVDPAYARRRLGRRLMDEAERWARTNGFPALTLTTFTDVAWNGPYYERCGFHYLVDDALSPGLRAIRDEERAAGLDRWPRACMRKPLAPG